MRCAYLVVVLQVCLIEAENDFVRHSVKKILIALSDYFILKAQVRVLLYQEQNDFASFFSSPSLFSSILQVVSRI